MKKKEKRKKPDTYLPAYTYQTGGRRVGPPPVHHPLDAHYYSVVDEPQPTEFNIWFHLGNQL